jgi:hypothetical protein
MNVVELSKHQFDIYYNGCPLLAHSGQSRHCNILVAIGQERTFQTPDE